MQDRTNGKEKERVYVRHASVRMEACVSALSRPSHISCSVAFAPSHFPSRSVNDPVGGCGRCSKVAHARNRDSIPLHSRCGSLRRDHTRARAGLIILSRIVLSRSPRLLCVFHCRCLDPDRKEKGKKIASLASVDSRRISIDCYCCRMSPIWESYASFLLSGFLLGHILVVFYLRCVYRSR